MKRAIFGLVIMLALTAACAPTSQVENAQPADLVLTGGNIKTDAGWAEALAIRGNEIIMLGTTEELNDVAKSATNVVELDGRTVLPGFHDMHVHPLFSGLGFECDIADGLDLDAFREALRDCVSNLEPGEWVVGRRWDISALGIEPTRQMIDDVAPQNPVFLNDTSGHSALVNSLALELAGVTGGTAAPTAGTIVLDENGDPTGVLHETAMGVVSRVIPSQYSQAEIEASLLSALRDMERFGITSFVEASTGFSAGLELEVRTYADFADRGLLRQRVRLCLEWFPETEMSFEAYEALRRDYERDMLSVDCIKMYLDGVPTESHTAAMLQPYIDSTGGTAANSGKVFIEQETLHDAVTAFDKLGFAVKYHAAGDAAVRAGLDAIEAARSTNGKNGPRHSVGHCTFVSPQDMTRGPGLDTTFEMSPYLWTPSPISSDIANSVGPDLIRDVWPVRSVLDAQALVIPGSDWAVVPSVNPWIAVEALVTREATGGSEASFGKRQAITVEEAIDLFTINSARHLGREAELGSITVGKIADLIVVDRNPYDIPAIELHKTRVDLTIADGAIIFDISVPADE